jgi:ketosteroid isomerase-like protein
MSTSPSIPVRGTDLQSEFQRLAQEFASAFNKGDFEKIGSFYTPDAIVLPPHHEIVQGAVNIPSLLREFQQMGATDLKLEVTRVEQFLDTALEIGRYSMLVRQPDRTSIADRGKYMSLRRRLPNNQWRIYADAWNSDLPLA